MKRLLILTGYLLCLFSMAAQEAVLQGGGGHTMERSACLSPEQRHAMQDMIAANRAALVAQGILSDQPSRGDEVYFETPLANSPELPWNGMYGISNFVDQQPGGGIQEFNCTERTYNGHQGVDYYTWPFGHYLKENDLAWVVAGAPGVILAKLDGQFDEECAIDFSLTWNAVYVEHSDGSVAWYGHLKEGSLTSKSVGETVSLGEYLGVVASSGASSGPHLHFELHESDGSTVDLYAGDCNDTQLTTRWVDQPPFWEMKLNTVLTHDQAPEFGCPSSSEEPHLQQVFGNSDVVFVAIYFKEEQVNAVTPIRVYAPDGSLYSSWDHVSPADYESSYWYYTVNMPFIGSEGSWTVEVDHPQGTYSHNFLLDNDPPASLTESELRTLSVYPNPASDFLRVELPDGLDAQEAQLRLLDARGRQLRLISWQHSSSPLLDLPLDGLAPGMYILRVDGPDASYVGRFGRE